MAVGEAGNHHRHDDRVLILGQLAERRHQLRFARRRNRRKIEQHLDLDTVIGDYLAQVCNHLLRLVAG